jgi:hypothetical protein
MTTSGGLTSETELLLRHAAVLTAKVEEAASAARGARRSAVGGGVRAGGLRVAALRRGR